MESRSSGLSSPSEQNNTGLAANGHDWKWKDLLAADRGRGDNYRKLLLLCQYLGFFEICSCAFMRFSWWLLTRIFEGQKVTSCGRCVQLP